MFILSISEIWKTSTSTYYQDSPPPGKASANCSVCVCVRVREREGGEVILWRQHDVCYSTFLQHEEFHTLLLCVFIRKQRLLMNTEVEPATRECIDRRQQMKSCI